MDAIFTWLKSNVTKAVGVPALLSGVSFFGNLFIALSDGVITEKEFHNLLTSSNGVEMIILVVLYVALKKKD